MSGTWFWQEKISPEGKQGDLHNHPVSPLDEAFPSDSRTTAGAILYGRPVKAAIALQRSNGRPVKAAIALQRSNRPVKAAATLGPIT